MSLYHTHLRSLLLAVALVTGTAPHTVAGDMPTLADASWDKLPAWRGSNLLNRFHLNWQNKPFERRDFEHLADFGFNFVRLPMDYRVYTASDDWLNFDETVLSNLDQAIAWANELGIHAQINLHRIPGYTVATPAETTNLYTNTDTQEVAAAHWMMFAKRYAHLPNSHLSFNLINEPNSNVTKEQYVDVVSKITNSIREETPNRLIIIDGFNWANEPIPELIPLKVAQSFHMYEPFNLTHYGANWVSGSNSWARPTWPSNTVSSYLYAPSKSDLHSTLTILTTLESDSQLRIKIGSVSSDSTLLVKADGETVYKRRFQPGPGKGDWTEVIFNKTWGTYQNLYLFDVLATIPKNTKRIEISNAAGDWMNFIEIGLTQSESETEHILAPGKGTYGSRQDTIVQYNSKTAFTTDDPGGQEQLWEDKISRWAEFKKQGVGVMSGEWGAYKNTPHDITLAWTRDLLEAMAAADIPWSQWDYYGTFGPFDSEREDVDYESYKGRELDRAMMGLLQEFALPSEN